MDGRLLFLFLPLLTKRKAPKGQANYNSSCSLCSCEVRERGFIKAISEAKMCSQL